MRYARKSTMKAPTRRNFKINAFGGYRTGIAENLVDLSDSKFCYNFVARDGELTEGTGTVRAVIKFSDSNYTLPQPKNAVLSAWYYKRFDSENEERDDRLLVYTDSGELLSLSLYKKSTEYVKLVENFSKVRTAFSYRLGNTDVMLISTDSGLYKLDEETIQKVDGAPDIVDACIHYERAFACVKGEGITLWFSDSLDPTDWTVTSGRGGYIQFSPENGALNKVLSFGGYLYVFRDYGIERVTAYGDESEFNVKCVYSSTDRIFSNTVSVCGDRIMFLSEKGLHYFDGMNVVALRGVVDSDEYEGRARFAKSTYYSGVYYLALYVKSLDTDEGGLRHPFTENNCILSYDTVSGRVDIMMDYDIYGFCPLTMHDGSIMLTYFYPEHQKSTARLLSISTENCMRCGSPVYMYWRTGMTDLGYPEKKKSLKSLTVRSSHNMTVGVMLDGVTKEYAVRGGAQKKLLINGRFEKMGMYFKTYGIKQRISTPVVTVDMR